MKKNLSNVYYYEREYYTENDHDIKYKDSCLSSVRRCRHYKTKMYPEDLPETYCCVHRVWCAYNMVNTVGVKDMKYTWVMENHFMKDSVLHVSFTGDIDIRPMCVTIDGVKKETFFKDYINEDVRIYGTDILKYIGYVKKYSNVDITGVRDEFIRHCEWLREHKPEYAPNCANFGGDFGEYFDNAIKEKN